MKEDIQKMIIKSVTDEWVAHFSRKENRSGVMWRLAKSGYFPVGVDIADPRVTALLNEDDIERTGGEDDKSK